MAHAQLSVIEVNQTLGALLLDISRAQSQLARHIAKIQQGDLEEFNPEIEIIQPMRLVSPIDDEDYLIQPCECPFV